MFAIVNTDILEVISLLDERPKAGEYLPPFISLYITSAEAANVTLPSDEWLQDETDPNISHRVHAQGTILTQVQFNAAVTRQDALKDRLQTILDFGKSVNGKSFSDLSTTELKGLLQLLFAIANMVDVNGNVDLSDFTVDSIVKIMA